MSVGKLYDPLDVISLQATVIVYSRQTINEALTENSTQRFHIRLTYRR